jgi:hypothetical protein
VTSSPPIPAHESCERRLLSLFVMFQAGRTATAFADADHLANQFGKAWLRQHPNRLRHHLKKEGRTDLLEHLPKVEITMNDAVLDAVG